MKFALPWPWARFAEDKRTIDALASQWEISCGEEIRLHDKIMEMQEQMLQHSKRAIEQGTKITKLELELSGVRAKLNSEMVQAANARGEALRLSAEINSTARSSVVIYPPTDYSPERLSELEQEMNEQNTRTQPDDPGYNPSELDQFTGWPFGSGA